MFGYYLYILCGQHGVFTESALDIDCASEWGAWNGNVNGESYLCCETLCLLMCSACMQ